MTSVAFTGILPAAGLGTRLRPLRCPKELLPVAFFTDPVTGVVRPMLAAEHSLYAMRRAGVRRCVLVINDRKPEILRYFGDGRDFDISIAYVNQPEPLGLAAAVDAAYRWVEGDHVCLALPDTLFSPSDALTTVVAALARHRADLVLGVFPTTNPEQLGPVDLRGDGSVIEVFEKPASTHLFNTWGIAAWTPRFTEFLHRPATELGNLSIGHLFNEAVRHGLHVRAVYFESGSYTDLGTGEVLAAVVSRGMDVVNVR